MTLLTDHDTVTLVRLLKVAYPHEAFPDGPYERTAQAVLDAAAGAPRQLAQLIPAWTSPVVVGKNLE